ncbi:MAG: hypothetical protein HY903_09205 [Deltaproteobacteria bacterium]|nr:hypothetical protein [Deltaproteobacteria bacterium]
MASALRHHRGRSFKNYLLNRRLQLSYALSTTALSATVAATLGFVIYEQSVFASSQILAGLDGVGMEWVDPGVKAQIRAELGRADVSLVATMVGIGVVLALVLMASLIVMTHKVAGPLWRMSQCLDAIAAGRLPVAGSLRKGDFLQGLFVTLGATTESLRARAQSDLELADAVLESCAQAPGERPAALTAAVTELREAQRRKRAALA